MKLPHWPIPYGTKDINLGLSIIKELLRRIGNPHLKLPPVVHVAGTNGKGSTIAYLKSILEAAGYKVHRYTSPHLIRFNERIELAGKEIDDEFLSLNIEETRIAAGDLQTTFFEGTTAAAFLAFSRVNADILLLETGLGGRLDSTNVVDNPLLSIITPISFDHQEYLGYTLTKIASEKAGIIKKNRPCVISWQYQESMDVLLRKCNELQVDYFSCGHQWNFEVFQNSFLFTDDENAFSFPKPSLNGLHQIVNAATAVAAVQLLDGFNIRKKDIDRGLQNTFWPARMQRINSGVLYSQLPQHSEMWLDGAHNVSGAEMLIASIENMDKKLPLYLINGRSKDRDIRGFLEHFVDKVELLCATHIKSEPLSERSEIIHEIAQKMGFNSYCSDSIRDAISKCLEHAAGKSIRIIICGSLYLAGDILAVNQGII